MLLYLWPKQQSHIQKEASMLAGQQEPADSSRMVTVDSGDN